MKRCTKTNCGFESESPEEQLHLKMHVNHSEVLFIYPNIKESNSGLSYLNLKENHIKMSLPIEVIAQMERSRVGMYILSKSGISICFEVFNEIKRGLNVILL